ncbi:hypothetical protein C0993_003294 [Termitomyces sp. T159_Od127]|nr:hypothetical protein C0993_003294 [Termitomyces sp. T159_Od127]
MKHQKSEMYKLVAAMTPLRKDIWASQEAAVKWMQARPPWSSWDQRVFDVYTHLTSSPTTSDREVQDSIVDPKEGRKFASITRIKGVGHLVVQEAPAKLAKAIFAVLRKTPKLDAVSRL